jgi:hypothetical protein
MKRNESKYKIPNCTPRQLMKLLAALKEGGANQRLVNALVKDKDAHHQRNMAIRFELVEESEGEYVLTELGKHVVSLYGSDEFSAVFRKECIPRVPIFQDTLRLIKFSKEMTKGELKERIKDLASPDPEWSPTTLNQYTNLVIGYLKLADAIEYQRNKGLIRYVPSL